MQLQVYEVDITKLVEYVDRKEDPLTQTVSMHQHNINSAILKTARCLKTAVGRNKTNEGQHRRENKRKMVREDDAWTNVT